MSEISSNNKRIEYIDALRGFTMILVVFYHISLLSFGTDSTFCNKLFLSFRMPLFFFISGFIGYKANIVWNRQIWWIMCKKKLSIQLLPTLIFGLIYAYAYRHVTFSTFVMDFTKFGYWFTIVLLEMFLIVYTLNVLVYNSNTKVFRRRQLKILISLSVLLFVAKYILDIVPFINKLSNIFSLYCLFEYFPFFVLGYICSMNKEKFHQTLEHKYFSSIIILLFCICFYVNLFHIYPRISGSIISRVSYHIFEIFIGFCGLLIAYNTFRIYQNSFISKNKVGIALQYIGRRTLDIYLLHWFFLPYIPQVGDLLSNNKNFSLEITFGVVLSLIVIGICLAVSNILRTSPMLGKYLFGMKN